MSNNLGPLLCLTPNWIGDAVLALPALQDLAQCGVPLHLVGRPSVRRVLEEVGGETKWVDLPAGRIDRLRCAWRLRRTGYAGALLFTPSFSSALFAWCAGARTRCGEASDGRKVLLTHPLARIDRSRHLSSSYRDIAFACLRILGAGTEAINGMEATEKLPSAPLLQVRHSEMQSLRELPEGVERAVVIAPGARFGPAKQYPPERFAAAARTLAAQWSCAIVLVGTAEDAATTTLVRNMIPESIDLTGRTNLGQLLAIVKRARVTLSNDSGTMHLAAAVGGNVVGVFGSTNPAWTAPLGSRAGYIVHPVFCSPCYARHCREDFACMLNQSADALVSAARQVVESVSP